MAVMSRLRQWARDLKRQTRVVYFAARDARTPWFVRLLALGIAAYALSPIDLIPDFIPVLGYLDDLLIVPLGVLLVLRLTPGEVLAAARIRADEAAAMSTNRTMATAIVMLWVIALALAGWLAWRAWRA